MEASIADLLLKMGLPGVIILTLGIAYIKKDKKVDEVNEKRIAESRESIKAIEQSTSTLETLTEVLRDRKNG